MSKPLNPEHLLNATLEMAQRAKYLQWLEAETAEANAGLLPMVDINTHYLRLQEQLTKQKNELERQKKKQKDAAAAVKKFETENPNPSTDAENNKLAALIEKEMKYPGKIGITNGVIASTKKEIKAMEHHGQCISLTPKTDQQGKSSLHIVYHLPVLAVLNAELTPTQKQQLQNDGLAIQAIIDKFMIADGKHVRYIGNEEKPKGFWRVMDTEENRKLAYAYRDEKKERSVPNGQPFLVHPSSHKTYPTGILPAEYPCNFGQINEQGENTACDVFFFDNNGIFAAKRLDMQKEFATFGGLGEEQAKMKIASVLEELIDETGLLKEALDRQFYKTLLNQVPRNHKELCTLLKITGDELPAGQNWADTLKETINAVDEAQDKTEQAKKTEAAKLLRTALAIAEEEHKLAVLQNAANGVDLNSSFDNEDQDLMRQLNQGASLAQGETWKDKLDAKIADIRASQQSEEAKRKELSTLARNLLDKLEAARVNNNNADEPAGSEPENTDASVSNNFKTLQEHFKTFVHPVEDEKGRSVSTQNLTDPRTGHGAVTRTSLYLCQADNPALQALLEARGLKENGGSLALKGGDDVAAVQKIALDEFYQNSWGSHGAIAVQVAGILKKKEAVQTKLNSGSTNHKPANKHKASGEDTSSNGSGEELTSMSNGDSATPPGLAEHETAFLNLHDAAMRVLQTASTASAAATNNGGNLNNDDNGITPAASVSSPLDTMLNNMAKNMLDLLLSHHNWLKPGLGRWSKSNTPGLILADRDQNNKLAIETLHTILTKASNIPHCKYNRSLQLLKKLVPNEWLKKHDSKDARDLLTQLVNQHSHVQQLLQAPQQRQSSHRRPSNT